MKTCAVIPTYNNIGTVADIVRRTLVYLPVIVVADGPTDGSLEAVEAIDDPRLCVVSYARNRGKGYALKQGLRKAQALGYTHVLTLDSDGQHYPEDIPQMLRMSAVRPEAIVIGSRGMVHDNMPKKNTFANRFSNFWFHLQTGFPLPDTQSGFRVYPLHGTHGIGWMTRRYEAELLLLVFSSWANTPIVPVPIRVYYPPAEERVSYFHPLRDFTRISLLNTLLCILAVVYGWPRSHWRFFVYVLSFLSVMLLANIVCALYAIHPTPKAKNRMHRRLRAAAKMLLDGFPACDFHVENNSDDALPLQGPCVVVGNHTTMLDIVTVMYLCEKVVVIGQDWVKNNPFFGFIAHTMGVIMVGEGIDTYMSRLQSYVDDGYSVLIFPEGTRSTTGELLRFHRGACYVAEQLRLPIRPILFDGYAQALPKKPFHVGAAKEMKATVLPLILPDDSTWGKDYRERTKNLRAYYYNLIDHSRQE